MEASANTFDAPMKPGTGKSANKAVRATAASASQSKDAADQVMITDALTDVRQKFHINPKEIGHGHYGVVRKCMHRETKEWYAIKSIRKSKVGKRSIDVLKREIAIYCRRFNIRTSFDLLKFMRTPSICISSPNCAPVGNCLIA